MVSVACENRLPQVKDLPVYSERPDPFKMLDGKPIRTKEDWINKRRPELKLLFQHYVYGYLPPEPHMGISVQKLDTLVLNGQAIYKEIILHLQLPARQTHSMHIVKMRYRYKVKSFLETEHEIVGSVPGNRISMPFSRYQME